MFVGTGNKPRGPFFFLQNKASGVKRVRRGFVGKESQLARIGCEQIIGRCRPAHLRHVHESRIGDQKRFVGHFLKAQVDSIVPVHIRLNIMKDQQLRGDRLHVFEKVTVNLDRPLSPAGISGKQNQWGLNIQGPADDAGCGQECGGAPADADEMLLQAQAPVMKHTGAFVEREIVPRNGSDNHPGHRCSNSS